MGGISWDNANVHKDVSWKIGMIRSGGEVERWDAESQESEGSSHLTL